MGPRRIPGPAKGSFQGDLILRLNMLATVPGERPDVFDGMLPLGRPGHVSLSPKILHTVVHTSTKKMSFILKGLQLKKPWKYQLLLWKVRPLAFCSIWRKRTKDLMEGGNLEWTQYKLLHWNVHSAWANIQPGHNQSRQSHWRWKTIKTCIYQLVNSCCPENPEDLPSPRNPPHHPMVQ